MKSVGRVRVGGRKSVCAKGYKRHCRTFTYNGKKLKDCGCYHKSSTRLTGKGRKK